MRFAVPMLIAMLTLPAGAWAQASRPPVAARAPRGPTFEATLRWSRGPVEVQPGVGEDARPRWNSAPHRRHGFHNLHRLTRYATSHRAARVLDLRLAADLSIPAREDVRRLTASPWFSAMAVTAGKRLLFQA